MDRGNICEEFKKIGEYAASGAFEESDRSLFYRKALGIRRYYENCRLCEYSGKALYPSGKIENSMDIFPEYYYGLSVNWRGYKKENAEYINKFAEVFSRYRHKIPPEHTVAAGMWVHSIPNYRRVIKEGLNSYVERINKIADADMREGLLHIYEGIKNYIGRIVTYLSKAGADKRLVDALKKVPLSKADNIYEAIVAWNFIMYLDNCDNIGCLAKDLYEFYNGEDITDLLGNLYDNLDENEGWSMALGTDYNELTIQCLKASKEKRRPMIELFVDENTPDEVWETAFEVMRTHNGQPAFYNPKVLFAELKDKLGVSDEDMKEFCGGGCTESMIAGHSNVGSVDAGIHLLLILENTIYGYLAQATDFEDFYERYIAEVKNVVDDITEKISLSQKERAEFCPVPMRTFLIDDCIDNGREYYAGGARYMWSIINYAGMINVIDAMQVIRDFVFDAKTVSAEELCSMLKANDEGFLKKCREQKNVFGTDNAVVDAFANRITTDIYSMTDGKKPYIGKAFLPSSIQFDSQVRAGKNIGATPDGRRSGEPLCDSIAAIMGKDVKGPTALLKSVTSLNLKKALGVPILNFNIDENWSNDVLKALILSYMEMGGIQMQISCASEELLREAYENPELHRNLVVRVGGYSEYFCRLTDEQKIMIMNRTVQKGR